MKSFLRDFLVAVLCWEIAFQVAFHFKSGWRAVCLYVALLMISWWIRLAIKQTYRKIRKDDVLRP